MDAQRLHAADANVQLAGWRLVAKLLRTAYSKPQCRELFLACTQHASANGLLEAALSCLRARAATAGVLDSVLRALALFSDISMLDASFLRDVVAAMRGHPLDADLQCSCCGFLVSATFDETGVDHTPVLVRAGAIEALVHALRVHNGVAELVQQAVVTLHAAASRDAAHAMRAVQAGALNLRLPSCDSARALPQSGSFGSSCTSA